jgi:pilus assembly protein CpaB
VFLMIPVAIGLGLVAIKAGRHWLDRQVDDRMRDAASRSQPAPLQAAQAFGTIVVAGAKLKFGAELAPNVLREIPWPDGQAPRGAFAHVADLLDKDKRFVLSGMEEGEAILAGKITGPGQRANLAAILAEGMKAVTIRVDEVVGVAGFVLPGDHVDVLLTRVADKGAYADVLMQDVKVLAIDQTNDDRALKPTVARAVTVEVATDEAQRLIVAQNVGSMTLVLRPVGTAKVEANKRITTADLLEHKARDGDIPVAAFNANVTVGVIRGMDRKEYAVPPARKE